MNTLTKYLLGIAGVVIVVVGLYQAGKYAQRKIDDTVTKVTSSITNSVRASLQESLNKEMGGFRDDFNSKIDQVNKNYAANQNSINRTRDQLNNLSDVWLRVDKVRSNSQHVSDAKGTGSQSATSQSGSDGTYYAQLPNEDVQFLKGEAYRADQCAVRLNSAQQALVQYEGAFELYQRLVREYLAAAQVSPSTVK